MAVVEVRARGLRVELVRERRASGPKSISVRRGTRRSSCSLLAATPFSGADAASARPTSAPALAVPTAASARNLRRVIASPVIPPPPAQTLSVLPLRSRSAQVHAPFPQALHSSSRPLTFSRGHCDETGTEACEGKLPKLAQPAKGIHSVDGPLPS